MTNTVGLRRTEWKVKTWVGRHLISVLSHFFREGLNVVKIMNYKLRTFAITSSTSVFCQMAMTQLSRVLSYTLQTIKIEENRREKSFFMLYGGNDILLFSTNAVESLQRTLISVGNEI